MGNIARITLTIVAGFILGGILAMIIGSFFQLSYYPEYQGFGGLAFFLYIIFLPLFLAHWYLLSYAISFLPKNTFRLNRTIQFKILAIGAISGYVTNLYFPPIREVVEAVEGFPFDLIPNEIIGWLYVDLVIALVFIVLLLQFTRPNRFVI